MSDLKYIAGAQSRLEAVIGACSELNKAYAESPENIGAEIKALRAVGFRADRLESHLRSQRSPRGTWRKQLLDDLKKCPRSISHIDPHRSTDQFRAAMEKHLDRLKALADLVRDDADTPSPMDGAGAGREGEARDEPNGESTSEQGGAGRGEGDGATRGESTAESGKGQTAAANGSPETENAPGQKRSVSAKAVEALLGDEARKVLEIVNESESADTKMRRICGTDRRFLAWNSEQWAELLGVKGGAIRKTQFWKVDRQLAIDADRELKGE